MPSSCPPREMIGHPALADFPQLRRPALDHRAVAGQHLLVRHAVLGPGAAAREHVDQQRLEAVQRLGEARVLALGLLEFPPQRQGAGPDLAGPHAGLDRWRAAGVAAGGAEPPGAGRHGVAVAYEARLDGAGVAGNAGNRRHPADPAHRPDRFLREDGDGAVSAIRIGEAARNLAGEIEVVVDVRSYRTAKGIPAEGFTMALIRRLGNAAAADRLMAAVKEAGSREGLDFRFDKMRFGDTTDAHAMRSTHTSRSRARRIRRWWAGPAPPWSVPSRPRPPRAACRSSRAARPSPCWRTSPAPGRT